jgi:hypothetical protein
MEVLCLSVLQRDDDDVDACENALESACDEIVGGDDCSLIAVV